VVVDAGAPLLSSALVGPPPVVLVVGSAGGSSLSAGPFELPALEELVALVLAGAASSSPACSPPQANERVANTVRGSSRMRMQA